jgi:hypothetical protein
MGDLWGGGGRLITEKKFDSCIPKKELSKNRFQIVFT